MLRAGRSGNDELAAQQCVGVKSLREERCVCRFSLHIHTGVSVCVPAPPGVFLPVSLPVPVLYNVLYRCHHRHHVMHHVHGSPSLIGCERCEVRLWRCVRPGVRVWSGV